MRSRQLGATMFVAFVAFVAFVVFAGVAGVLLLVAVVATWVPASAAARVDPSVTLRSD